MSSANSGFTVPPGEHPPLAVVTDTSHQMAANPPRSHLSHLSPRALSLISSLKLSYLPHESGYIGLLDTSSQTITTPTGQTLAAQSHNYYMLTKTLNVNYLHWLESDDVHILVEGGPVEYFIFHPEVDGNGVFRSERVVLGRDFERGETAVVAVSGGCWKGVRLREGVEFALMGNVLCPEFTVGRVRIGFQDEREQAEWVGRYVGTAEWATEEFLKGLIGGN
jgi:predicted cupin superfamily sugar epimerase